MLNTEFPSTSLELAQARQRVGFPGDTSIKNPPANAGGIRDAGLIPG